MKKIFTQNTPTMEPQTISRRPVARGPKAEILNALRGFARAYAPMHNTPLRGVVLN